MNVLTLAQRVFLAKFFAHQSARSFYLTGGGALAEFYLKHRVSQDIDLFTQNREDWLSIELALRSAAEQIGGTLEFKPAIAENELHRAILYAPGEAPIKIDIVRDAPPHFGGLVTQPDGVIVDSLDNMAVGKLLALFGRAYPRDYVDLYFLLIRGVDLRKLIRLGKEKDPGLDEYYLAGTMRQIVLVNPQTLPKTLEPIDIETLKQFFLQLADKVAAGEYSK